MRYIINFLFAVSACVCVASSPNTNLITNGGFESGLAGWRPIWSRQNGAATVNLDRQIVRSGGASAHIEHHGANDWSFEPDLRLPVRFGDIFQLDAWIKLEGHGSVTLCASTWDARDQNVDWSYGGQTIRAATRWQHLRTRFIIPPGVARIQPRLIGDGPAELWLDDCSLLELPGLKIAHQGAPTSLTLTNPLIVVTVNTTNAAFSVLDRRTGRQWRQPVTRPDEVVTGLHRHENALSLDLLDIPSGLPLRADLELEPAQPEFTLKLTAKGRLPGPMRFPYPFASRPGDRLIVPMNEGISYPVEDKSIEPMRLIAYGGHSGICMAFWGVTDGSQGYSAIIETPNDAAIRIQRLDGRLVIAPEWDSQKGQFGYPRELRYTFFDKGGHVAIAKRYRKYAQHIGLFKTLAQKRRQNPNVDLLIGAVNVWNWDADPVELVKEMQAAGIKHILWSRGGSPEQLRALNKMKVLTSRYDIYQDVMDPANFRFLRGVHPDWPTAAWPKDIMLRADGSWAHGWGVRGANGKWFYCGVLCDSRALGYARKRIPADLATHPYKCRFIETTTASPWRECYSTNHPMTRTDSRNWRMRLLDCVSREFKLVTGSETGIDAAVPYVDYFEGMLSLAPYRVPDSGRNMQRIWDTPPPLVAKFQLGQAYRIPLWELVYHDCVVAQWYWGDYNNKLPTLWDKRDLFNVLYGTPPMFMFNARLWKSEKDRFVQSYRNTCPYVRAAGYSEMTDHRFLTPDRNVQQTVFSNGMKVTVNFGEEPYPLPSGQTLKPLGFIVSGMPRGQ